MVRSAEMANTSVSDPLEPRELGTLIVVVGKAVRHSARDAVQLPCCCLVGILPSRAGFGKSETQRAWALTMQRNLPNKSRFGKQDPFCSVRVGDDKKKTKPIKR